MAAARSEAGVETVNGARTCVMVRGSGSGRGGQGDEDEAVEGEAVSDVLASFDDGGDDDEVLAASFKVVEGTVMSDALASFDDGEDGAGEEMVAPLTVVSGT